MIFKELKKKFDNLAYYAQNFAHYALEHNDKILTYYAHVYIRIEYVN